MPTLDSDHHPQLSRTVYPQPNATPTRGQTYSRTPIVLPPLPIERVVIPIPWVNMIFVSCLAALCLTGIDWFCGAMAADASMTGSLQMAMVRFVLLMGAIVGLSLAFYKAARTVLGVRLGCERAILWGSILFVLPVTTGLRWLVAPGLFHQQLPATSHMVVYMLCVVILWTSTFTGLAALLLRLPTTEKKRQQLFVFIIGTPNVIALILATVALVQMITAYGH